MAPSPFDTAKLTLDYLPYACEFDPQDANRLLVGGGGGANRSGVANKITVIDTSAKDELRIAGEADLSRNEDSVMTLAVGPKKGRTSHVYAGINSSPADVEKGKNEHFRVFGVEQSKARLSVGANSPSVNLAELSRSALFAPAENDKQRRLRLSAPFGEKHQLGAVATGLAKQSQISLFEVSAASGAAVKPRGTLEISREAMDLDVIQTGDETFQVAFCDERDLFVVNVTKNSVDGPHLAFTIKEDGAGVTPIFRSIRYLSPNFIMAGCNLPKRTGVVLLGIRLPMKEEEKGRLAASAKLPKTVTQATTIAVRNLNPASTPEAKLGNTQFVVAVAGQDRSVSLFTVEHKSLSNLELLTNLERLTTLKEVHPLNITNVALSHFVPPKTTARPQYLKLASISMKNTVVVHSILLKKFTDREVPLRKGGPPRPQRYAVALQPKRYGTKATITLATIIVLVLAVLFQIGLESAGFLSTLIGEVHTLQGDPIVIREDAVTPTHPEENPVPRFQAAVHDEAVYGPAVSWDDLSAQQKKLWKEKLSKAGHWTQNMGESVFKGILFGELAGAVRQAVAGQV
uniref:Guanine nucleotide-exchange factor SEC12 n=1 Tax=Colletotrichum fructicola (strain Nara gc5) TaxID=1213859 RepID=L2FY46_COLFN